MALADGGIFVESFCGNKLNLILNFPAQPKAIANALNGNGGTLLSSSSSVSTGRRKRIKYTVIPARKVSVFFYLLDFEAVTRN